MTWRQAFNLTFISFYQNLLLLLIVAPSYISWQHLDVPLGRWIVAESCKAFQSPLHHTTQPIRICQCFSCVLCDLTPMSS